MKNKNSIKDLVERYLSEKDESSFKVIYDESLAKYKRQLDGWVATTREYTEHEVQEMFDETLLSTLGVIERDGGDFDRLFQRSLYNRYKSSLRKLSFRRQYDFKETPSDDGTAIPEYEKLADDFDLEEEVTRRATAKRKADQRQLIDFLVCGENERTTAIVQAYLTTELKTPTAIGNHLGLDHKQVSRALNRLAAKFNSKQFGSHRDYLVAL